MGPIYLPVKSVPRIPPLRQERHVSPFRRLPKSHSARAIIERHRDEDDEIAAMMIGDEEFERGNVDISSGRGNEHGSADQNKETEEDGKEEQRDEDVGDELDAIARKQAERYGMLLERRYCRNASSTNV